MHEFEKEALISFMINVLYALSPHHKEFPLEDIKEIYEKFGADSNEFNQLPDFHRRAFLMRRSIEVMIGKRRKM